MKSDGISRFWNPAVRKMKQQLRSSWKETFQKFSALRKNKKTKLLLKSQNSKSFISWSLLFLAFTANKIIKNVTGLITLNLKGLHSNFGGCQEIWRQEFRAQESSLQTKQFCKKYSSYRFRPNEMGGSVAGSFLDDLKKCSKMFNVLVYCAKVRSP